MEIGLFDGGPPVRLEGWLHLRRPGEHQVVREALLAATVAWVPLALLAAANGELITSGGATLLPFVPVLLLVMPLDVMLQRLASLLV